MRISRGDVVKAQGFPDEYPLMVLAIAGGRVAIGSPLWPCGANRAVEFYQITSVNGVSVKFEPPAQPQRRKAA